MTFVVYAIISSLILAAILGAGLGVAVNKFTTA